MKRANKIKKIPFALLSILLLTNPYKTFAIEEEWQYIEDDCSKDKLAGIEKDKLFSIEKAVQMQLVS